MVNLLSIPTNLVFEIGIIIITAAIAAYLLRLAKQPSVLAYILAGIVLGPVLSYFGFSFLNDFSFVAKLSEIGIAFLLFIVGMELDLSKLKSVGGISVIGGVIQVAITSLIGFFVSRYFGFAYLESMYIGFVLAFSSTMLVVKILKDKEQVDTLHGRILIGILLVQDLLVIFVISLLSMMDKFDIDLIAFALLKGIAFILIALIAGKFIIPRLFKFAAKSEELLFLCSISLCFLFSIFAYSLGFSIAIGAFIAGVILANIPYSIDVIGMVGGLKDFFVTIFFVSLGMQLVAIKGQMILVLIAILLLTLIAKPLIVMILASLFGYEKRTSFLTSLSLGQISEFSLIMVSYGFYELNQLSPDFFSLIIFATIISMVITSYLSNYDAWLYLKLSKLLSVFERISLVERKYLKQIRKKDARIVLFGCHRMGNVFLKHFRNHDESVVVIDHNPETIESLIDKGVDCVYGDCTNIEVLKKINMRNARIVISAVPNLDINEFLLKYAKKINKKIIFMATQNHLHEALDLYEKGADYVMLPHISASEASLKLLETVLRDGKHINFIKNNHIKHLLSLSS